MPPHCDSLDGPVVTAARKALRAGDVDLVLPFVPADGENEVRQVFDHVLPVRSLGKDARDVAERLFFETVVRVHRAGEGEPYTGLRPAGQPVGPAIPLAERAAASGSASDLVDLLAAALREEVAHRLGEIADLGTRRDRSVEDARRHVEAVLGLQVYAHRVLETIRERGRGHHH